MQTYAGFLLGARLKSRGPHLLALGQLSRDMRNTHATGELRDFSFSNIHTSAIEKLVRTDRGVDIYTSNSIYQTDEDLMEGYGEEVLVADLIESIKEREEIARASRKATMEGLNANS